MILVTFGCQNGTLPSASSDTTDDSTKDTSKVVKLAPIMNWTKLAASNMSLRRSVAVSYDDFTLGTSYNFEHCVAIFETDRNNYYAQLSAPLFSGFEKADNVDGTTYTNKIYARTVTTTVKVDETTGSVTFSGKYNDGGGHYELTINADNTYTFDNFVIFDEMYLCNQGGIGYIQNEDGSWNISEMDRAAIISKASGTITVKDDGTVDSDGESTMMYCHLLALKTTSDTKNFSETYNPETGATNVTFTSWFGSTTNILEYKNITKSRGNTYLARNKDAGNEYTSIQAFYARGYMEDTTTDNFTYSNATLKDTFWNLKDVTTSDKILAYTANDRNFLISKINGVWNKYMLSWNPTYKDPNPPNTLAQIDEVWNQY
jgi:hypothetical protein